MSKSYIPNVVRKKKITCADKQKSRPWQPVQCLLNRFWQKIKTRTIGSAKFCVSRNAFCRRHPAAARGGNYTKQKQKYATTFAESSCVASKVARHERQPTYFPTSSSKPSSSVSSGEFSLFSLSEPSFNKTSHRGYHIVAPRWIISC